jgi:hypothetical protein
MRISNKGMCSKGTDMEPFNEIRQELVWSAT